MKLPGPLAAALAAADDHYLIGLCNKGTVNRAKKDLAALAEPSVTVTEEGAQVQMGDVTCQICAPLGEPVLLPQQRHLPPPDHRHSLAETAGPRGGNRPRPCGRAPKTHL